MNVKIHTIGSERNTIGIDLEFLYESGSHSIKLRAFDKSKIKDGGDGDRGVCFVMWYGSGGGVGIYIFLFWFALCLVLE